MGEKRFCPPHRWVRLFARTGHSLVENDASIGMYDSFGIETNVMRTGLGVQGTFGGCWENAKNWGRPPSVGSGTYHQVEIPASPPSVPAGQLAEAEANLSA